MESEQLIYIKTNIDGYFFDAVMEEEHKSNLKITSHPVQLGANVSDHAYMEPLELSMTIKMSDCNTDVVPGQFSARYTRSASALAVLQELQASRIPFRVHTRLRAYDNMLIKSIVAPDDASRIYGMECTVTMQEVLVAEAVTVKVSKRWQTTGETDAGISNAQPVEESVLSTLYGSLAKYFVGGAA